MKNKQAEPAQVKKSDNYALSVDNANNTNEKQGVK